jgi:hypothetical protein
MELPVFELMISEDINDDAEVNFVSLVDRPAIQRNWQAFCDKQSFNIASEERRIISGPIMLANTPIFRSDVTHGDYYVVFSKETIFQIVQRYFKKKYQANVNLNHNQQMQLNDVVMFESFISDKERGIMPMRGFEDAPDGSWFGSMKVDNDYAWNEVKAGNIKGFSVEGIFQYNNTMTKIEQIKNDLGFGGPGSGRRPEGGSDNDSIKSPSIDKIVDSKNYSPEQKNQLIKDAKLTIRQINSGTRPMSVAVDDLVNTHGLDRRDAINVLSDVENQMKSKGEKTKYASDILKIEKIKEILSQVK